MRRSPETRPTLLPARRPNGAAAFSWPLYVLLGGAAVYVGWRILASKKGKQQEKSKETVSKVDFSKIGQEMRAFRAQVEDGIVALGHTYPGTTEANWSLFAYYYNEAAKKMPGANPPELPAQKRDLWRYWLALQQVQEWLKGVPGATLAEKWQTFLNSLGIGQIRPEG